MNDKSDQHDQDCNPDWWKELRALSLKRKVKQAAKDAPYKPGDSFLIVTEGTVTEPVYFELVIQQLQIATVQVKVLPSTASDPRQVVIHADKIAKEQYRKFKKGLLGINEPSFFDHVWTL
jgi:alcohol dehydrogenase class IV